MTGQSDARKQRRAMKRAGVSKVNRLVVERAAIAKLEAETEHDAIDLVMHSIDQAIRGLAAEGVDVLHHTVVTIGEHPDYPDAVTIEAKV